MNLLFYLLISGYGVFIGLAFVIVGILLFLPSRQKWTRSLGLISILAGIFVLTLASASIPLFLAVLCYPFSLLFIVCGFIRKRKKAAESLFRLSACLLLILIACIAVLELNYYLEPAVKKHNYKSIYVIGDSISAGIGMETVKWPGLMSQEIRRPVINNAMAGACTFDAKNQLSDLPDNDCLIIIEIGGNDMLKSFPISNFRYNLDNLLKKATSQNNDVIMIELPLMPFSASYGRIQRSLAKKYNVPMIPKRFFARILTTDDNLIDGLHLSDKGHREMAKMVGSFVVGK